MGKIYKNQTKVEIKLDTGLTEADLVGATVKIKYRKEIPGTVGEWAAIVDGTKVKYIVTSVDDLDVAGIWVFWVDVTFADGTWAPGQPYTCIIYDQGY